MPKDLGASPSALSQSVRRLEERLGVTLLRRTSRSVTLTEAGEWLLEHAGPAVDRALESLKTVTAKRGEVKGRVQLGVLLEEVLSWVRTLPGSKRLQALVLFDEVYGFLPPHPANPPTKRPLVALMKQARAFGVGIVVATQNSMDLDYRALGNAGVWCVGRLQTDAD